uniref:Uncharacterized protein n=1 Tax=Mus musculus TaxID=10090 RepID=Q8BTB3_MOUSE|nr:unnamed protein product [Mus musculus]BAE43255.1 unnamed protein product [Mus musculus]
MAVPNFEETLDILCYNEPRRKKRNITATVPGTVRRIRPSRITAMEGCSSCQLALINDIEGEGQSA